MKTGAFYHLSTSATTLLLLSLPASASLFNNDSAIHPNNLHQLTQAIPLLWLRETTTLDPTITEQTTTCIQLDSGFLSKKAEILISKDCLENQSITKIQKELFEKVLDLYLDKTEIHKNENVRNTLIRNRFFDTTIDTFSNPVDIRQNTVLATREFFHKTSWLAHTDPTFRSRYPELFEFLNWTIWSTAKSAPEGIRDQVISNTRLPRTEGAVHFLANNVESWWARYLLIQKAEKSIDIQYFIIDDDVFGRSFLALLLEKAKNGVQIRLMVDRRGTPLVTESRRKDLFQFMARYGIQIKVFNPFVADFPNINIIQSNHDKIMVVDDRYFMTGGRNISSYYFVAPQDEYYLFSDADVLIDSPQAAAVAKLAFQMDFDRKGYEILPSNKPIEGRTLEDLFDALKAMEDRLYNETISPETKKLCPKLEQWKSFYGVQNFTLFPDTSPKQIEVIDKNAGAGIYQDLQNQIFTLIENTKEELIIENPYVVLTPRMKQALKSASERGVQIIIRTNSPASGDSAWTQSIFEHEWRGLLADIPNLKIFAAKGPMKVHAKLFVFDRKIAVIGSYNLDNLSENINSEIAVLVDDTTTAQSVLETIHYRIVNDSVPYTKDSPSLGDEETRRNLRMRYWIAQILRRWI